jgi:hypothetical protein
MVTPAARALLFLAIAASPELVPTPSQAEALDAAPSPPALADPDAIAEMLVGRAARAEDEGAFASALQADEECAARAPDTRWGPRAAERATWLRARSEGAFAPLARLERVRRDPALADDPATIDALARDADTFPPGLVRVEARLFVAEAWLRRMARPRDGTLELRRVTEDPEADPLTARLAEGELVRALVAQGEIEAAIAEARAGARRLDAQTLRSVAGLARRRWARRTAFAVVAAFVALAAAALVGARRTGAALASRALRASAPVLVGFVVFVGAGGGALAARYESGNSLPFLLFGAAVLPLVFVARAWSAVGSPRPAARASRALLCATTVLATAFLLLDLVNPAYLEGFGL